VWLDRIVACQCLPLMLWAIAAAKKKNDRIDTRARFASVCGAISAAIRKRRRTLRYRHLLVRQMVQMKIKAARC
jgi:hypothetical protein